MRWVVVALVAALCALPLPAAAQDAPPPDPSGLAALDPAPHPLPGVRQNVACVQGGPGEPQVTATPWAQQQLRFTDAWRFTRGEGQTVAVIDTGVAPHPRLAGRLLDGGDFVGTDGGTRDCDGHGTLVAGIIAAAPDPRTGFVGVAPAARILSIRQSSATVTTANGAGGGNVVTLADAVLRAVRLGADVINISEAACVPATTAPQVLAPLRAAVHYAVTSDVVVVAAAGNAGSGSCSQGAGQTVAPASFSDDVLSVAYTGRDGRAAPASIRGPWVSLAAPGADVVSLSPAGAGTVDRIVPAGSGAPIPIEGTSFATPYVSGVVALVRARYPGLTARQVRDRVVATASGGPARDAAADPALGSGVVDPVAAVADVRPAEVGARVTTPGPGRVDLSSAGDAHSGARTVAVIGTAGVVVVGGLGLAVGALLLARRAGRPRRGGRVRL